MMADYDKHEDFYEEDEPADKIFAAFDKGEKGVTVSPLTQNIEGLDVAWIVPLSVSVANVSSPAMVSRGSEDPAPLANV
jgi:hypothetical protein